MPPLATSLSLDSNIQVLIVMMALVVGFSLQDKFGALFNGLQRYSIFSITLSLAALACLVALCWRYFVGGEHLQRDGMVIYVLFTLLPAMVLAIAFYFDHHRANGSRNGLFSALRLLAPFSLFSYVTNTIQLLAYRIDYWILDHYHPGAPLGWYSLAVRLIQVLWFLPVVMATIFFPEAASSKGMPATTLSRAIRHLNGLNLLLLVLLLLVIRPAISVFFGDTYLPSAYLVLLLLPGMVSFGITTLIASYMAGENRLRVNFIGSSICLILVLILDLTLIPRWGASGAAMASSIAYLGTTIYFILVYRARSGSTLRQLFLPSFKEVRELPGMLRKLTKIIGTS
jgi:O-antigen/teichoic acid export membrane protein